jgi:hypothetical protein
VPAYACLRVDWNNTHKINGSYAVFIDYSNPSTCLTSSGASYILVLEQPSYEYLAQQVEAQMGLPAADNSVFLLVLGLGLAGMFLFGFSFGQRIFYK